jgi:hypothetical protein
MGNWLTDLVVGKVQLPPMSIRIELPGGVAISPGAAPLATSAPVNRSSVFSSFPSWLIPAGIIASAAIYFMNRARR